MLKIASYDFWHFILDSKHFPREAAVWGTKFCSLKKLYLYNAQETSIRAIVSFVDKKVFYLRTPAERF